MWENWSPAVFLMVILNGSATMENNMIIPQKMKTRIIANKILMTHSCS